MRCYSVGWSWVCAIALSVMIPGAVWASLEQSLPDMHEFIVLQTEPYSCGAAAMATLLTIFYDQLVTEREILDIAKGLMQERQKRVEAQGLDALALRDILLHYGVESRGIQTNAAALAAYFDQGGLPVMMHMVQEQAHYVVAIGVVSAPAGNDTDLYLVIADPAWGYRQVAVAELMATQVFSGFVLVPLPSEDRVAEIREHQRVVLERWDSD